MIDQMSWILSEMYSFKRQEALENLTKYDSLSLDRLTSTRVWVLIISDYKKAFLFDNQLSITSVHNMIFPARGRGVRM